MLTFGLTPFSNPNLADEGLSGQSTFKLAPHLLGHWVDYSDQIWDNIDDLTWQDLLVMLEVNKNIRNSNSILDYKNTADLSRIYDIKDSNSTLLYKNNGDITRANDISASSNLVYNNNATLDFNPTIYDYLSQIRRNTNFHLVFMDLLRDDETVERTLSNEIMNGTLSVQLVNGVRRNVDVTFSNSTDILSVDEFDLWIGKKFRIRQGIIVQGEEFTFSQGIFVVTNVEQLSGQSNQTIRITGQDKWSNLNGTNNGFLGETYLINSGSNISAAISAILNLVDDPKADEINFEATTVTTPYDLRIEAGRTYSDILTELALMLGRDAYYDTEGRFTVEERPVPAERSPLFEFTRDDIYMSSTVRYDFSKVFNAIEFKGASLENGIQVQATSENNDLTSPYAIGVIGRKVRVVTSDVVVDNSQAQISADYELTVTSSLQELVNMSCTKVYHLDVGNIITVDDPNNNLDPNIKYEINNFTLGLMPVDRMEMQVNRARKFVT